MYIRLRRLDDKYRLIYKVMKIPEFAKKIGWAVIKVYKGIPIFLRRVFYVILFVVALWLTVWLLCHVHLNSTGSRNSLVNFLKKVSEDKPQLEFITDLSAFVGVVLTIAV